MNETTAEKLKPSHKESELLLRLNEYTSQAQELAEVTLETEGVSNEPSAPK
ncbi:hypothetical protein U0358_03090 [Idiomarina sp. PL1-037]|uniref:hypothetical protein n=1 Tax=Idiomarina sp. PL1-037 TaxID=3095365 RepID=UPI002ACBF05B|nr:hypothetical protein [Idiomarina sp. PL1-037]WQC53554.1 hypothetical protein U0358_03090 [Idiomarina sp. PL1-037]